MGVLCLVFMIGALRINVVLVFLLFTLTMAFTFFTGAYWSLAKGNVLVTERLVVVSGLQSGSLFAYRSEHCFIIGCWWNHVRDKSCRLVSVLRTASSLS